MKKTYCRITFILDSPLSVGSGENKYSDSDIILDSLGKPFIPATSFAGIIRHYFEDNGEKKDELFGCAHGSDSLQSKLVFYDATTDDQAFVTVRDGVKLENRVAVDQKKFDFEASENGLVFTSVIEGNDLMDHEEGCLFDAFCAFNSGFLRLGSKVSRGYGKIRITKYERAEFNLPDDRLEWLEFDAHDLSSNKYYTIQEISSSDKGIKIICELQSKAAVSVRSYMTHSPGEIKEADYAALSLSDGTPVIPGTSWAGAFRFRFEELSKDPELTNRIFGYVDEKEKTQQRSHIFFSETRLHNGTKKLITRNSIDRFSGRTKDGALYTEKTVYNGETTLEIILTESNEKALKILMAVLCDLDRGFLTIGGLAAVGRGLFSIKKLIVCDKDITKSLNDCNIMEMAGAVC